MQDYCVSNKDGTRVAPPLVTAIEPEPETPDHESQTTVADVLHRLSVMLSCYHDYMYSCIGPRFNRCIGPRVNRFVLVIRSKGGTAGELPIVLLCVL